jgi:hypothetical protein
MRRRGGRYWRPPHAVVAGKDDAANLFDDEDVIDVVALRPDYTTSVANKVYMTSVC